MPLWVNINLTKGKSRVEHKMYNNYPKITLLILSEEIPEKLWH